MSNKHVDILIITPIYKSNAGGAGIYYQMLCDLLSRHGRSVCIVSERDIVADNVIYEGLFPAWAGRDRQFLKDRVYYLYQNITYFWLPMLLLRYRPTTVLIHSSFHNHPGLFGIAFRVTRRLFSKTKFVADVRDKLLPVGKLGILAEYDHVIACSVNVVAHVHRGGVPTAMTTHIPVIQKKITVSDERMKVALMRHGLVGERYIYYLGAIKEDKGVDRLLETYDRHLRDRNPGLLLVLVGLMKSQSSRMRRLISSKGVRYLGNLQHAESMALMKGSTLCVNLSLSESISRVCLEAISLGRPVIVPSDVPEFQQFCPECVAAETSIEGLARKMQYLLDNPVPASYPVEDHFPESVIYRYLELLG